jgi:hypothetical protein
VREGIPIASPGAPAWGRKSAYGAAGFRLAWAQGLLRPPTHKAFASGRFVMYSYRCGTPRGQVARAGLLMLRGLSNDSLGVFFGRFPRENRRSPFLFGNSHGMEGDWR